MTKDEIVARVELELRYHLEYDKTHRVFSELYLKRVGRVPKKKNLLNWFFEHYEFDGSEDTWYERSGKGNH